MKIRGSGLLLHITSLPSRFGIGDLGPGAYRFADFLAASGQRYWQILPTNPTDPAFGNSPYSSISAFAQNTLLISPELLAEEGLLTTQDLAAVDPFPDQYVDFDHVIPFKEALFDRAHDRFVRRSDLREFEEYCRKNAWWLDEYALFTAIRDDRRGEPWPRWPDELKRRRTEALREEAERLRERVDRTRFLQYICMDQWKRLRRYCTERDIRIIGDLPIYMDYASTDVWQHPEYFNLDDDLQPVSVSGVPADYFSSTGQLWGQPVYRWDTLQKTGFAWWVRRLKHDLECEDYVRIDHFRGFVAYWEVPAGSSTAMIGTWVPAPAQEFFDTLRRQIVCLPVVAEDLASIDPFVRKMMEEYGIPGMRVLIIAFQEGSKRSLNSPHHAVPDSVLYTGTHDTNTVRGWFEHEATASERDDLRRFFGREISPEELPWEFIRLAMSTVTNTVVIPVQDVLELGSEARMNRPGTGAGNWRWRLAEGLLTKEIGDRLRTLTVTYARD
jgi:4-alpha-glucanotransferase